MFAAVLGLVTLALTLYGLATRESDEERLQREESEAEARAAAAREKRRAAGVPAPPALAVPPGVPNAAAMPLNPYSAPTYAPLGLIKPYRSVECKLQPNDYINTDAWTAKVLPQFRHLSVPHRLQLLSSAVPYFQWPEYARRIDCALKDG